MGIGSWLRNRLGGPIAREVATTLPGVPQLRATVSTAHAGGDLRITVEPLPVDPARYAYVMRTRVTAGERSVTWWNGSSGSFVVGDSAARIEVVVRFRVLDEAGTRELWFGGSGELAATALVLLPIDPITDGTFEL
jgi:hypothetical protein